MTLSAARHSGAAFALLSALLFGASTPLAKALLGSIDPWLLAGWLYAGSGLGLAAWRLGRRLMRAEAPEASLSRRDLPWLGLVVLFGGVLGPVLLMVGLATTQASTAALLLNLEGLATMAIAWVVFRENVDARLLAGALAILAGAVLLSWSGGLGALDRGAGAIAAACLCWGIDNNLTRKLSGRDPAQIAMVKGLVAGATNIALALGHGAAMPAFVPGLGAIVVGFLGYGVSLVLFVRALRQLGTARASAYFSAAPFIGAIMAVLLFGETPTLRLMGAGVLMAIGIALHLIEHHEHDHEHTELRHEHAHTHDAHHQHAHDPADPPGEPHVHAHEHKRMVHRHRHHPDLHHRHGHSGN